MAEDTKEKVESKLKELSQQIVLLVKKFNKKQQYVILGTLVIVIGFIAFLVVYTNSNKTRGDDGFRILFSSLTPKDAGLIVAQLEQNKIEYKIPKDGTIEVKREIVNKTRMDIAALGLPKESVSDLNCLIKKSLEVQTLSKILSF